jgi:hypothetical protein
MPRLLDASFDHDDHKKQRPTGRCFFFGIRPPHRGFNDIAAAQHHGHNATSLLVVLPRSEPRVFVTPTAACDEAQAEVAAWTIR